MININVGITRSKWLLRKRRKLFFVMEAQRKKRVEQDLKQGPSEIGNILKIGSKVKELDDLDIILM